MQTYNTSLYSHLLATHFAYGYGSINQHFETYKGTFQSHALSFSLMDRILLENINIDIGLHGTFGFFATRDMLQFLAQTQLLIAILTRIISMQM